MVLQANESNNYVTHKQNLNMNQSEKENSQAVSFCCNLLFKRLLVICSILVM